MIPINRSAPTREWLKIEKKGNVLEEVDELCRQFGPYYVSVSLGELGLSVEDMARSGKKLSQKNISNLTHRLNEKVRWRAKKYPVPKKAFWGWYDEIKNKQVPKNKSMISYFERQVYLISTQQLYHLPKFLNKISDEYGLIETLIAIDDLTPSAADRIRCDYGISKEEKEKVEEAAYEISQAWQTESMQKTKEYFRNKNLSWADSPSVTGAYKYYTREECRSLMWKEWHKSEEWNEPNEPDNESYDDHHPHTLYINGMPVEEYEEQKDRQDDRTYDFHEDDEPTGCTIS